MMELEKDSPTIGEGDFVISQESDQSMDAATETNILQDELMRAKLDVQVYSTTLTSLQQTLRAMEKTIQELRDMQSLPPTKSHQKQAECHNIDMQHSIGPSTDVDPSFQKQQSLSPKLSTTVNPVISNSFNLTDTSAKLSTESSTTTSCFEMTLGPNAPISLYKGTCTSYLCHSCFSPSGSSRVFVYDHKAVVWSELAECPNTYFSLVTVNGLVTAVGGWRGGDRKQPTNTLLSLLSSSSPLGDCTEDSGPDSKRARLDDSYLCAPNSDLDWSEHFPPMPTNRGYPATVYHNHSLIVAGGDTTWLRDSFLTTVEVLNIVALQWYTVSSLPAPLRGSTAAVCINQHPLDSTLYLLGGWDKTGNAVYACSLRQLLSTAILYDPKDALSSITNTLCSCCWKTVASAPFSDCSCVTLRNQLFVFGGRGWNGEGSECVHTYDEPANQWVCVGKMSVGRSHPLVAKLADDCRVVVVGGMTKGPHVTSCCEVVQLLS